MLVQERTLASETGPKLRSNLIGRLLGRDEFRLEGDSVVAFKRGRRVVSVSIGGSRKFGTFSEGFLGGQLTLNLEDGPVKLRFLSAAGAEEFLRIAPKVPVRTEIEPFALADANQALAALRSGALRGAAVLVPPPR